MPASGAMALRCHSHVLTCVSVPGQPFGTSSDDTAFAMALNSTPLSGEGQICLSRGPGALVLPPASSMRGQPAQYRGVFVLAVRAYGHSGTFQATPELLGCVHDV